MKASMLTPGLNHVRFKHAQNLSMSSKIRTRFETVFATSYQDEEVVIRYNGSIKNGEEMNLAERWTMSLRPPHT
ncbi:hypothetical protein DPMN_170983 [Dreissena polymorpha]|uniref:Uncharacterized protein n=1 Tax=Dreissena polymorpha TaxID=45954 RepID=A0A9D4DYX2_DREPO|nr:hypothetical protein DPMN_170983 [Dreissena polymorpha]